MNGNFHEENFLALRKSFPTVVTQRASPTAAVPFRDPQLQAIVEQMEEVRRAQEEDYRVLLSGANKSFFQREYSIALEKYLELRNKILVESHPEMPGVSGTGRAVAVDITKVDHRPIFELSRRYFAEAEPQARLTIGGKRLILSREFPVNSAIQPLSTLGLDGEVSARPDIRAGLNVARGLMLEGNVLGGQRSYAGLRQQALRVRDYKLTAELTAESAAMVATYAAGANRREALTAAAAAFQDAEEIFRQLGDEQGVAAMKSNLASVQEELRSRPEERKGGSVEPAASPVARAPRDINLPTPQTTRNYLVADAGIWKSGVSVIGTARALRPQERQVGLFTADGIKTISLGQSGYETELKNAVYNPRISATTLDGIEFREEIETNFVAYIPHLFFFVLPVAIGDTYLALGRYSKALDEYKGALAYPFLNTNIEVPFLWLRMAKVYLRWGDDLFRQDLQSRRGITGSRTPDAKSRYEQIIRTDVSVPLASPLYQPGAMTSMRTTVGEVAKKLKGEPHAAFNSKVAELVTQAHIQLTKIAQGLNFLGLAPDHFPILRFKYLQAAANYLADNAIQAERTFVNFRATAENQKLERIQLENAVELNQAALDVENKRLEDAALERTAAQQGLDYTKLRKQHADESVADWETKGWELATINEALTWMGHATSDTAINYTGVKYKGTTHDVGPTIEDAVDVLADWRERINYQLQLARLKRQAEEVAKEVELAGTRQQQAAVRYEIQVLMCDLAQLRLEGAQEVLDYATDRMFDEDLWFKLAGELQDISRSYLDMAIYAAFLMERAYDLEFDRNLKRIRLDYGIGGTEGLLGGDYLKRDIASFTVDYLEHAQKMNPVRLAISLRDEFPAAFDGFIREGILPFRTDLEIFDRGYPGSFRRKIKRVEIFVEGLVPLEGVHGTLLHEGISTDWREAGGSWIKHSRVMPAERQILSSYQYRRDFTVFQPSEEVLGLFENIGVQGNWRLELPRSSNNIDYRAIGDVKFVLYFDADYNHELAAHVKSAYSNEGGRSLVLSARFHFPDEYFRLDMDRKITFRLHPARFAYNYVEMKLLGFGVRLLSKGDQPLSNTPLAVVRSSDGSIVQAVTGAQGTIEADQATMAPFQAWKGSSPVDSFSVQVGPDVDTTVIADIQLSLDYAFTYRPDGVLA